MRQFFAGLSVSFAFIVGCLAGRVDTGSTAVASAPDPSLARDEYQCITGVQGITKQLNAQAQLGWRLVTAVETSTYDQATQERFPLVIWCLERRR